MENEDSRVGTVQTDRLCLRPGLAPAQPNGIASNYALMLARLPSQLELIGEKRRQDKELEYYGRNSYAEMLSHAGLGSAHISSHSFAPSITQRPGLGVCLLHQEWGRNKTDAGPASAADPPVSPVSHPPISHPRSFLSLLSFMLSRSRLCSCPVCCLSPSLD